MKKITRTFITVLTMSSLIATPVFAAPGSVNQIKTQKDKVQKEIDSLQADLTKTLMRIDEIEVDMIEKGEDIIQATSDLEKAQKKEKKQYKDMKLRIKLMYENGGAVLLTKIFESGTISEMLKQAENMQALHTYDRKKLEEFVKTKEEISTLKATLEEDMEKMKVLKADMSKQKETLARTLDEKKAEEKDLDKQLQEAVAEAARKAAEEQKRKEEEQRKKEEQAASNNKPLNNKPSGGNQSNNNNNNGGSKPDSEKPGSGNGSGGSSNAGSGNIATGQAIVAAARRYIGVPYVWGGMSSSGVDCSGLTSLAHRAVGIYIPRNSAGQACGGKNVGSLSNALPGDIICYPGHVAIYIGGNRVIHAPTEGQNVKEASVFMGPSQPITAIRRYW